MHPYRDAPDRAFWKRAVVEDLDPASLAPDGVLLARGDRVASAGSCFAANLVPYLERAGFHYVRAERPPAFLGEVAEERFAYAKFSAAYGNIYTVRQAVQLLLRALGRFQPVEDRWHAADGSVIDPFRPGLRHRAASDAEFDALTRFHLARVLEVFRSATVFVLTLGLTEAWRSKQDGAVYPACPGTIAGVFNPERHEFHNFRVSEVVADLDALIALARELNPDLRFILTVSPVPLVATATRDHVVTASVYSKSVLRVAAAEAVQNNAGCTYFPAYEIVTGAQAPRDFLAPDRRQPTGRAIDAVMRAFLSRCEASPEASRPPAPRPDEQVRTELSARVAAALCEEEAQGA